MKMKSNVNINSTQVEVDLSQPIDISMPLHVGNDNPTAWYVNSPVIEPIRTDQFVGAVAEGGSVNFRNISFNPHGHGTHTECVGHISKEIYSINKILKTFFFLAELISITPEKLANGDQVITWKQVESAIGNKNNQAIVIRTMPNPTSKLS